MATPPTWTTRHGTTPDIRDTLQSGKLTGFDPYSTVTVREVVVSAVSQDMPLLHLQQKIDECLSLVGKAAGGYLEEGGGGSPQGCCNVKELPG